MASPEKIAANRQNARRSTGPRTTAGKARALRNAFRHGLSIPVNRDHAYAVQIEELVDNFTDIAAAPREIVRLAAETQLGVTRVQQARIETINRNLRQQSSSADDDLNDDARMAFAIVGILPRLPTFDRYEQRARSKAKKAMRTLENYQRAESAPAIPTKAPLSPKSGRSSTTKSE